MADEMMMEKARQVYGTICAALDARNWTYQKNEADLVVYFGVNGEDIPMQFMFIVDAERQLVRFLSPLPFKMCQEKRIDGAIAACAASYTMADGSFDYDLEDGTVIFRMTAGFRDSVVGEGLFQYLISCACAMVDQYNEKFLAINKGLLSISDFVNNKE